MKKLILILITLLLCNTVSLGSTYNVRAESVTLRDSYGNIIGTIKKRGNSYYETDKYGNTTKVYKQSGDMTYIYDRYGRCVGSFKKGMW